jgi:hypothetical protein
VWEKIKGLIRSQMMAEMAAAGYRFLGYDGAKDEMEFKDGTGSGKGSMIAVIDDPCEPVEQLAERMIAVRSRHECPLAAVQSAERATRLHNILAGRIEPILICDVVDGRAGKPRKVSDKHQKAVVAVNSSGSGGRIVAG